ncbi:hypothetical protein OIU34_02405 [Pararhizobium sp. BT-229]|uniref:hypothetical protein n=1 Tax=Pararhizobium sp. BT-229 TaxID=2986923 RepID=UPI0021F781C2|nr:hypothetical protein [Pararhizobium sp. BT-229]MCV9960739.1 hypothetical protein [Pararhizobium sp. BT-229]
MSLLKNTKITVVAAAAAAAQTDLASSFVDMYGFDGVLFVALTGDVSDTSALALKASQNTVNNPSGAAELVGGPTFTAGATNADNKALVLDVYKPRERYVRAVLKRGTANAAVSGILAIQYSGRRMPTEHDASVIASALLNDPNEA